jgi:hypothetical protein
VIRTHDGLPTSVKKRKMERVAKAG